MTKVDTFAIAFKVGDVMRMQLASPVQLPNVVWSQIHNEVAGLHMVHKLRARKIPRSGD